ncbi:putative MFS transporter [Aspergillus candidus]|uniref:Putative MFS transporter n=1 Tax=Aspergillus candidus TaxID=41067 RepID=A0A2I2FD04_ASPCN|nr:putative MFS transporter [Aspergillus candidus]PLB38484.1 putative MFS transporter [Aspergillus candidus]
MRGTGSMPIGYRWRSSKWFIIGTICIALFADTFLYAFLVPILGYMFETRLHKDFSELQWYTSAILALHGYICALSAVFIGHFADKSANRKTPLVISLIGCIIGTFMIAWCSSLTVLFAGRVLQGVAGSVVWIVGLATIADTVEQDAIGTSMGFAMSFVNAGMISGPMTAGLLLELVGYWATWSVPLLVLGIDVAMRMAMIETREPPPSAEETASLLPDAQSSSTTPTTTTTPTPTPESNFWSVMLCDSRLIVALLAQITSVSISVGFSATLPLHAQQVFGWGTSLVGVAFAYLTVPGIVFAPVSGWLRDRVGIRVPSAIGFIVQGILLSFLGMVGDDRFPWTGGRKHGPALYAATLVALGIVRPFGSGVATLEATAVVKEYEEKQPGIFGPAGGLSRVMSMVEIAACLGLAFGPSVAGYLVETMDYAVMNWFWCAACLVMATLIYCFLGTTQVDGHVDGQCVDGQRQDE